VAFDSFRAQDQRRPRAQRRIAFTLVAFFHGVLITAGVAYSYWHIDELTPPTLRVTFMSAPPPPPPPPPPPAGGGSKPKKVAIKTKTPEPTIVQKPTELVQPREKPVPVKKEFRKHEDEVEDEDDDAPKGVKGGVKGGIAGGEEGGIVGGTVGGKPGGVIGGTPGGAGDGPVKARVLPPSLGAAQRLPCAEPLFPASLRRAGSLYVVMTKICVSRAGVVDSVTLLKGADPLLDGGVVSSAKACRYTPLTVGGTTAPFCYIARYEFKGQ
jgi:protein TonB